MSANPLIMNDDCHTPLDLARAKGFGNVVRAIEVHSLLILVQFVCHVSSETDISPAQGHLCLFAGWLKEHYGPGFLERFAPQFLSRKV